MLIKKILLVSFILVLSVSAEAEIYQSGSQSCANNECYSAGENVAAGMGLLVATFGVRWLVPRDARSFLTGQQGEVVFGGFVDESKLGLLEFDLNDIPDTNFGLKTDLAVSQLKDGFPTSLRYELAPEYAFFKNGNTLISVGTGLAVEKFMESKEFSVGSPLELSLHTFLSAEWKFKSNAGVYFLKMPVYRGSFEFIWSSNKRKSSWVDSTIGYQIEDNKMQNSVTHFVFLGLII